jgi:glycogen operon protein
VTWHGIRLHEPAWGDSNAQVLTFTLGAVAADEEDLHIILNMSEEDLNITLPDTMGRSWCCAVDTARPSPADVVERDKQKVVPDKRYAVASRSVVVFERRLKSQ